MAGKHLTDEELEAEWSRAAFVIGMHGPFVWAPQILTIQRFQEHPHWTPELELVY